ncbi:MAG: AbrB family transcriptional regulator [Rhodobacteraceae bacterium]|nr:MAG: AbrB family transcriptional regulator [Paracoccaceae bacterium]
MKTMIDPALWRDTASTLCVAGLGALMAWGLGLPAYLLTGPALAVSLAGLFGLRMQIAPLARDAAFIVIGIGIGATVTPETTAAMLRWPLAFVVLAVMLWAIMWACARLLRLGFGFDRDSAILASAPGHLSFVIGLSAEAGVDALRVTLVQAVRLLALTLIVPVIARLMGVEIPPNPLSGQGVLGWAAFAALAGVSLILGLGLRRARVPAALLIGAMLVSGLGHGAGVVAGGVAPWLGATCLVALGALIGTRFSGVTFAQLGACLGAGLAVTAMATLISGAVALAVAGYLGLDPVTVLAAFAPGGFETMIALGAVLGGQAGFVAAAHVVRLMILTVLIPAMLGRRSRA